MRSTFLAIVAVLAACSACGDDGGAADASFTIDIDNASCGDQLHFTGEYVDWDTDTAFCGIRDAVIEVDGDGAMDTTAPNGRFDLCIPRNPTVKLVVTQPTEMSMCSNPISSYSVPVILHANRDEILAGGMYSARAFTTARQASFFQAAGLTFDTTKAQVFVHVNGTPRAVSIAAAHAAPQAIVATTWAPGDTGHDVFFPNVDVGSGTTMLTVAGGAIGTGTIPLVAGTITNATVLVR
ncbi:MAG TPA: hypothetical protein VIV11_30975 [Kofleriaceae bacterium]